MIFGIGTDILEIERVKRVYQRHGSRFVEHLLLPAVWHCAGNWGSARAI